jgi:putative addiction module component (TIGR02574 family)
MSVTELEQAFEKLSAVEQEQFAEWYEAKLARGGFDHVNDEAWAAEVERRMEEIDSGKVKCIPAEQVFADLRRRHGREA